MGCAMPSIPVTDDRAAPGQLELATFSIVGRAGGAFGVAVATARPVVGALVPFVGPCGAIATQARVNTELGRRGMALLEQRLPIDVALSTLLAHDSERDLRQLHGLDAHRSYAHTGDRCVPWAGHLQAQECTAAGNMLANSEVVAAMVDAFTAEGGRELSDRLLKSLEAGQAAGGDKRGKQSAALLVWSPEPRLFHNLRVDDHAEPVAELRRLHGIAVEQARLIREQYGEEGLRLFSRVKN
jgi:uncharacterized Ntn-hydrolase superfamily protein